MKTAIEWSGDHRPTCQGDPVRTVQEAFRLNRDDLVFKLHPVQLRLNTKYTPPFQLYLDKVIPVYIILGKLFKQQRGEVNSNWNQTSSMGINKHH